MTLEQTLARLEEIVARLDEERMDLGEALALFEEGVAELTRMRVGGEQVLDGLKVHRGGSLR